MAHEDAPNNNDDDSFRSLLARLDESSQPGQVLARGNGIDPAPDTPPAPSATSYADLCAAAVTPSTPQPHILPASQPQPDPNGPFSVVREAARSLRSGVVWAALAGGVSTFGLIWLLLIYWSAHQHVASRMPHTSGTDAQRKLTQASMDTNLVAIDPARTIAASSSSASSLVEAVGQLNGLGFAAVTKPELGLTSLPGVHIDNGADTLSDPKTAALRTPVGALPPQVSANEGTRAPVSPEEIKLLVAPASRAQAGENSPLAIKLAAPDARLEQLHVLIMGLPPGASLSAGQALPPGGWQIGARGLDALQVLLPAATRDVVQLDLAIVDESGGRLARAETVIVVGPSPAGTAQQEPPPPVAHAHVASIARAAAVASPPVVPPVAPPAAPPARVAAKTEPAPALAAPPPAPRLSMDDDTALIERGRLLARNGDIAGARLLFERAADAGSGRAAVLLGETYDPEILAGLRVMGTRGDRAKARQWYARASELGVTVAADRLRAVADR